MPPPVMPPASTVSVRTVMSGLIFGLGLQQFVQLLVVPHCLCQDSAYVLTSHITYCCSVPAADHLQTCTQALMVRNTGNIRLSFTSVTSPTSATTTGCTATDMLPGQVEACDITQATTQEALEAGSANITLTVGGITARTTSPQGYVTVLPENVTQTIHPAVTQITNLTYAFERTDSYGTISNNGKDTGPVVGCQSARPCWYPPVHAARR